MMPVAHILGFPRIGPRRELKFALESYWRREMSEQELRTVGSELRAQNWQRQRDAGLDFVTVGDFAWYDHVLNTIATLGCLPERFGFDAQALTLDQYFTLARGDAGRFAMEMTKWFDTNYHYLVPEFGRRTRFDGGVDWLLAEVAEARQLGHRVKVALLGPLTLLHVGKSRADGPKHKLDLLALLVPAYRRLLGELREAGVEWVQMDEPILGLDLDQAWLDAYALTYQALSGHAPRLLLATYFESVAAHAPLLKSLPVAGLHVDLVRGAKQLNEFIADYPEDKVFSAGIIDGRNIWGADLEAALVSLTPVHEELGERLWVSTSCSLLHVPVDLAQEQKLDADMRRWLSFAAQKLDEVVAIKQGLARGREAIAPALAAARLAVDSRRRSVRIHKPVVAQRAAAVREADGRRHSPFPVRIAAQQNRLRLPLLPTTTIGSFPQTAEIRKVRAAYRQGLIGRDEYVRKMQAEIRLVVEKQEACALDVLVHGEPERNDMVEYFGELMDGYAFTENGWVQSYGSRCVKPPIIYGDVQRAAPMTVAWATYAQGLTAKPMKGMLTGPVTMLQWSFVRDDQPRDKTALQIALALRDEVCDLERAGIAIIQIDEPAFREGLPLKRRDWPKYLDWAVLAFRVASSGVQDATQIHTHMCYSEFNDILPAIAALDADVITIETSRSGMELLDGFGKFRYPNDIGPGIYDIHSPRLPRVEEMVRLLEKARRVIPVKRLWVNPDCGLKTRAWPETEQALRNMVEAARIIRRDVEQGQTPEQHANR